MLLQGLDNPEQKLLTSRLGQFPFHPPNTFKPKATTAEPLCRFRYIKLFTALCALHHEQLTHARIL
jgi:hypothetical protein